MTFSELGLREPILKTLADKGYKTPSPIQQKAIPAILEGRDVMAAAQTGTGKTAGFTLPILQTLADGNRASSNHIRALIVTPTRELAAQVAESVRLYSRNLPLSTEIVFGGVKINPQMMRLRRGADILVATPGRLLDLYQQNAVKFKQLEVLVLDEADRMLDMGFIHDIRKIIALLPKERQNLLFSATFSKEIRALAQGLIRNPLEISVNPENSTAQTVRQWLHPVDKKRKGEALLYLIREYHWSQALVFTKTKHGANRLTKQLLEGGVKATAIHGNKSQGARTRALADFKDNRISVLVATDIAARGLDIDLLPHVVNFDLPNVAEDYVHRIGRTGRAGKAGEAISLVSADEIDLLIGIERLIQKKLERKYLDGFEPVHELPETASKAKPKSKPNTQRRKSPARGERPKSNNPKRQTSAAPKKGTQKPKAVRSAAGEAPPKKKLHKRPKRHNH